MLIKCKYCGRTDLLPSYKWCPTCGKPLATPPTPTPASTTTNNQMENKTLNFSNMSQSNISNQAPDIEMVKNCVVWNLAKGEVARRINVSEFEHLSGAKGVYVQEGVVAVLMIDGKVVTRLSSGVYYFPTAIERFGQTLRHIWRFFTGEKQGGSYNEEVTRGERLGSELQNLGKNSLVDVILVIEGYIPIVLGVRQADFYPYTVRTQRASLEVGVTMNLEVTDFIKFRKHYLTQNHYCRIWDLQKEILDPVGIVLQEQLAHEDVESSILPPVLKARIMDAVKTKVNYVLQGVSVAQMIDICINSADFARYHELEHKLYCTNKELEYLIRTNEFKNRLIAENNSQTLKEARSEEDLRYSLNQLNKDRLLHDNEMEAFCQLLASQKKIRESQTDADTDKALLEIKGNSLVSEDDYEALIHELKKKKDERKEVETILSYQSMRRTEKERLSAERDIAILDAKYEGEIEQAQFETAKQELSHRHEIEKTQKVHETELKDIDRGETKKDDDYKDSRDAIEQQKAVNKAKDKIALEDEEARKALKRLRILKGIGLEEEEGLAKIDRDNLAQQQAHEIAMAKLKAESEQAMQKITAGMSPEQIAATNIKDLSDEAQVALAAAFSSQKENEWMKVSTEERVRIIQELADRSAQIDKESREQQERTLERMMQFMTEAMKTNASVVTGAVGGQQATAQAQMNAITGIAKHRIGEITADKEEYREEAHQTQSRVDKTQDSALHYTTMTSGAKMHTEGMKAMAGAPDVVFYIIPEFGDKQWDFTSVITMIKDEIVTPNTEIIVGTESFKAYDLKEFRKILDRKYSVECPKCGAKGLKGHLCPECGTQL